MTTFPSRSRRGFTIVEMMLSVSVLVMILTFVAEMMNSTAISTGLSDRHQETDSQARAVFDRMAQDFAGMPQRTDVDFIFAKPAAGSSAKMFFYSEAPAFSSTDTQVSAAASSVALIGYCVNTGAVNNTGITPAPPAFCLQRLGKALTWDATVTGGNGTYGGISFLTFPPISPTNISFTPIAGSTLAGNDYTKSAIGTAPAYSDGVDPDFDVLSSEVFRMDFCFEVKDLSTPGVSSTVYSNYPVAQWGTSPTNKTSPTENGDPTTTPATPGDRWYNTADNRAFICTGNNSTGPIWAPNGMADVKAIVVTIAILDANSRKIVSQSSLQKAASSLVDFQEPQTNQAANPTLMATTWQQTITKATPSFVTLTGMPPSAASQVRVYQRYFYLNN